MLITPGITTSVKTIERNSLVSKVTNPKILERGGYMITQNL